jgi:hypothetical protein
MKLSRAIVIGTVILTIGFAAGLYFAFFFQGQVVILASAAILFALLSWVGSGADLVGLLREMYVRGKDEERREKSMMHSTTEPLLSLFRRDIHEAEKAATDNNAVNYSAFMLSFQKKWRDAQADNSLRYVSRNAHLIFETLQSVQKEIQPIPVSNIGYGSLMENEKLKSLLHRATKEIDDWLDEWDKWA